jgi:lipopolysaccharide/colanic/teichoic acid biosynthesis glycosyltransferase
MRLSAQPRLWLAERFFVALLMFSCLPMLGLLAVFVHSTAGKPVFVTDEWVKDGRRLRAHRFRTAGRGEPVFRRVGRVIRRLGWDGLRSFWNVMCGEIRLRDILQFRRR